MTDWPNVSFVPPGAVLTTAGISSVAGVATVNVGSALNAAGTWPAANRAYYCPVQLEYAVTVFQMSFQVGVQSGNFDIGIYDFAGNRIVSKGSTAVPAAGLAPVDITDTTLAPGTYFLALCVDNTTATIQRGAGLNAETLRTCGVQQQAVGAVTLPNPAVFATPGSSYFPLINAHLLATV
jgi:hypothetical protein